MSQPNRSDDPNAQSELRIWASACAHVWADKNKGRESLADAIRQSEQDLNWDIGLHLGDFSAAFGLPTEEEGIEIVRQMGALTKHRREDLYTLCGNHDRNAPDETAGLWFRRWIDPMGEHPAQSKVNPDNYRYPVHGDFERYWFEVGNLRFLMMSDVNPDVDGPGRGELGGNPGGAVSQDTFDWWVDQVQSHHQDKIIVTAHHYLLRDTTVATGDWEGMKRDENGNWKTDYHGYYEKGTPQAASYLCWVGDKLSGGQFEKWLTQHPGTVDLWLGGHTHTNPDDRRGGKSHIETRYGGTTFINVAALTRWFVHLHAIPHSRLLTFREASDELTVDCYLHSDDYREQGLYPERQHQLRLTKPFSWQP